MKVIKIGASWCSGCIIMKKRWENIDKIKKIESIYYDYDIYEDFLKENYHIKDQLPIYIFLDNNNNELTRLIGEVNEEDILKIIMKEDYEKDSI